MDADALLALIPADMPTRPRAVAVLRSRLPGQVRTDDPDRPTWVVVVEDMDGTTYAGGDVPAGVIADLPTSVPTAAGDLIIGLREDDPVRALLPPEPYYRGHAIDFTDRVPPSDEAELLARRPDGLTLTELTPDILPRTEWADDTLRAFGSPAGWTEHGVGYVLLDAAGEVVAQGMAGPRVDGLLEMGVWTRQDARGRGYGTLVSLHAAVACEARGDRVWWNVNADNAPSIGIARRLGFTRERRYELVAYQTPTIGQDPPA